MNTPITQAVILAAGQGTRLRQSETDYLKPLYPLAGKPLIGYAMHAFQQAGVTDIHTVVGFERDELVGGLRQVVPDGMRLHVIDNPDWRLSNGISLLSARDRIAGPFFLSMADHLYPSELVEHLGRQANVPDSLYLGVDRKLDQIFDMDDATKVITRDGHIVEIGKGLPKFDAVDTGLFVCPQLVFKYLEAARVNGDCSLSDGVRAMARAGLARVVDIGDLFWQDVDTPEMLAHAEAWLAQREKGAPP